MASLSEIPAKRSHTESPRDEKNPVSPRHGDKKSKLERSVSLIARKKAMLSMRPKTRDDFFAHHRSESPASDVSSSNEKDEHTQSQNFSNPTHLRGNSTENLFEMRPQTSPAVHHAENTFVLYSGITQSLKFMEWRLAAAKTHQAKLLTEEMKFKQIFKQKWEEVRETMESFLSSHTVVFERSLEEISQSISLLTECIDAVKSLHMPTIQTNYQPYAESASDNQRPFSMNFENPSKESEQISREESESVPTIHFQESPSNRVQKNHARSVHRILEALQTSLQVNQVLDHCRKLKSKFSFSDPSYRLLSEMQKSVGTLILGQKQIVQEDLSTQERIQAQNTILHSVRDILIENRPKKLLRSQFKLSTYAQTILKALVGSAMKIPYQIEPIRWPLIYAKPLDLPPVQVEQFDSPTGIPLHELTDIIMDVRVEKILELTETFLRCYRYFMSFEELLECLIQKYCNASPSTEKDYYARTNRLSSIRLRVLVLLKCWLSSYPSDFSLPITREWLIDFLRNAVLCSGHNDVGNQLLRLLSQNPDATSSGSISESGDEILDKSFDEEITAVNPLVEQVPVRADVTNFRRRRKKLSHDFATKTRDCFQAKQIIKQLPQYRVCVLDFDPQQFAEQLSCYDHASYSAIRDIELLQQNYSKDKRLASHLTHISCQFNKLNGWVWLQIFSSQTTQSRAEVIKHFLLICIYLYSLKNYNSVIAITAALNNTAVDRLRGSWKTLGESWYLLKESFTLLISNNHALYRKEIQSVSPPCIPFVGMFLSDLTFLDDGNPNFVGDNINFIYKFFKISKTISSLLQYQAYQYEFEADFNYSRMFETFTTLSSSDAFTLSEQLEPREQIRGVELPKQDPEEGQRLLAKLRSNTEEFLDSLCTDNGLSSPECRSKFRRRKSGTLTSLTLKKPQ